MAKHFFLGFKNQKLVTIVISELDEVENAVDVDYYTEKPQEPIKQLNEWLKRE